MMRFDCREAARALRAWWRLIAFVALVLAFGLSIRFALAHGAAEWIERGGYRSAVGELCCGERDCAEIADSDVEITPGGYRIKSIDETVPFDEATPSPNGRYWRCYWGGKRKCFFAPTPST